MFLVSAYAFVDFEKDCDAEVSPHFSAPAIFIILVTVFTMP